MKRAALTGSDGTAHTVVRLEELRLRTERKLRQRDVHTADGQRRIAGIGYRDALCRAGCADGLVRKVEGRRIECDGWLGGKSGGQQWNLPDTAPVGRNAKLAGTAVSGAHRGSSPQLHRRSVRQSRAQDAPAIARRARRHLRRRKHPAVHRDIDRVGVVRVDQNAVGWNIGQVAGDVGPVRSCIGRAIDMGHVKSLHGRIDGAARGIVRIDRDRRDVKVVRVESGDRPVRHRRHADIAPRTGVCPGLRRLGDKEVPARGCSAVGASGNSGIDHLRPRALRLGRAEGRSSRRERAHHGIRRRAGWALRTRQQSADRIVARPERSVRCRTAPDPAGSNDQVGGERRVKQPRRVDQRAVACRLRRPDRGLAGKVRGSATATLVAAAGC